MELYNYKTSDGSSIHVVKEGPNKIILESDGMLIILGDLSMRINEPQLTFLTDAMNMLADATQPEYEQEN